MYMPRRCPKGTICIENMTFIFLIVLMTLAIMYYLNNQRYKTAPANIVIQKTAPTRPPPPRFIGHPSVLLNPFRFNRFEEGNLHPVSNSPFPWS